MSDLKALSPQLQTMLQIKLDGYIEACVLAAPWVPGAPRRTPNPRPWPGITPGSGPILVRD